MVSRFFSSNEKVSGELFASAATSPARGSLGASDDALASGSSSLHKGNASRPSSLLRCVPKPQKTLSKHAPYPHSNPDGSCSSEGAEELGGPYLELLPFYDACNSGSSVFSGTSPSPRRTRRNSRRCVAASATARTPRWRYGRSLCFRSGRPIS